MITVRSCDHCGRETIWNPFCSYCVRWALEQGQALKATHWGATPVTPRDVADQLGVTWDEKTEGTA
jgi:hypothetical protein